MLGCCGGYPGLIIPFNFLRGFRNRFTIAATFGATASTCLELFTKGQTLFDILGDTPWLRVFQGLLAVLIYGILFYPLFACLTTDNKLLGSILGFLYGAVRFSVKLATEFQCANDNDGDESDKRPYLTLIGLLPTYLCLLVVNIRFAVLLVLEIRKTGFQFFHSISGFDKPETKEKAGILLTANIFWLFLLIISSFDRCATHANEKWYLRVIHFIYKPRADFKFSTQFISTLMVAAIVIFQVSKGLFTL
ncbi:unnamed protein product [Porites lobata]|uniref:Uncharacterized protein n=1 Tax=Porites lobata TaxID=104759 RepID=A0ABN8PMI8_9CNID|nr:unnamed protein product [Porites lobata]